MARLHRRDRLLTQLRLNAVFDHALDIEALGILQVLQRLVRCRSVTLATQQLGHAGDVAPSAVGTVFEGDGLLVRKSQVVLKRLYRWLGRGLQADQFR